MIEIKIRDRIARVVGSPQIICGNNGYTVSFDFDSEWNEFEQKTAVFSFCRDGKPVICNVEFIGTGCSIPVITGSNLVEIGCYAGNIRTSSPAAVPCCECITDIPSELTEIPVDVYNELMEQKNLGALPKLEDDEYFVMTLDGDYVCTSSGDYVIAKG